MSSQTKLEHHLRYLIPLYPFLLIEISRITLNCGPKRRVFFCVTGFLIGWFVFSSLLRYPHSQTYFNEFVHLPFRSDYFTKNNPPPLLGSNIDWGQNCFYLKLWCDSNPEYRPIYIDYSSVLSLKQIGIKEVKQPVFPYKEGYYAIGLNELFDLSSKYEIFQQMQPIDIIAHSIYIYHLTQEDIDLMNKKIFCTSKKDQIKKLKGTLREKTL